MGTYNTPKKSEQKYICIEPFPWAFDVHRDKLDHSKHTRIGSGAKLVLGRRPLLKVIWTGHPLISWICQVSEILTQMQFHLHQWNYAIETLFVLL